MDNWVALWRSPPQAENSRSPTPPYMDTGFDLLQDVDWMREGVRLWINLWMDSPDSIHRETAFRFTEKTQHLD